MKTEIRNYIEDMLKESWNEVMAECSQEEINDISEEYNDEIDVIIDDIEFLISEGIEDLKFTLQNFLYMRDPDDLYNPTMIPDGWLDDSPEGFDMEKGIGKNIEYEGIQIESNINEDFKY